MTETAISPNGDSYNFAMPNSVVESGEVLYYPHIRFRDRAWLRTSLLYHEKIWRLVPKGIDEFELNLDENDLPDPVISDEIKTLRSEGIIDNEYVTPVVTEVGDTFSKFVKANLTDPERRAKLLPEFKTDWNRPWYKIYPEKMDPKLRELLKGLDLAREVPEDRHGDWELDNLTGVMYMYFLAQALSKNRPIISDNPAYQALAYAAPDVNRREAPDFDKGFVLATAAFETVCPSGVEHESLKKLLSIRDAYADERALFRQEIVKLAKDLGSVDHPDQVEHIVQRQMPIVKKQVARLERKLTSLKVDSVRNVFTFSVPVWAATAAATHHILPNNPYLIAGSGVVSVGFALTKYLLDKPNTLEESPWSYLLSLKREITPAMANESLIRLSLNSKTH